MSSVTIAHEPRSSRICAHERKLIHRAGAHERQNLSDGAHELHFLSHSALSAKKSFFYFTRRLASHILKRSRQKLF